ncbi:hypothetical protein [Bdellovibrio svalbardensis]|uniref:Porin n=1 Tax=Bdellovibrio svalbardensis TaxID=2972972 RepID=A0ABT6DJN6_9BACT|nr:hypothetical protein [Bdellovibrio svalbardensis]MDG0816061.1 hypothetical protein [Bdellovibrio svalbardensis]
MRKIKSILLLTPFLLLFNQQEAHAYPDFIGYSYSSCITCHYNGLGGGALNDYGRALFATEITARDVYDKHTEEETIAAQSGFLGSQKLPWWFRPGLKYRGLWYKVNPGSSQTIEKYINMQEDVNLSFFADKKQNVALITTISNADAYPPHTNVKQWDWYAKEYYLRWKVNNNLWLYAGQMDKAYGIRNVDHTAVNRSPITLGQFDQSLGAIAHFTYPTWDIAVNGFFGNSYDDEDIKQKGASVVGEYQLFENFKIGGSALHSENKSVQWDLAAFTSRIGVSKGTAVLAEFGLKKRKDKLTNADATLGTYAWIESLILIRRGYNILTAIETSKADINKASAENLKYSFGAMMFPLPRTELRFMAVNGKTFEDGSGQFDAWTLQSQIHVSY